MHGRKVIPKEITVDTFVKELYDSNANFIAPVVFAPPLNTATSFQPLSYAIRYLGEAKDYCTANLAVKGIFEYSKTHAGAFAALIRRDDILRHPTDREFRYDLFDLGQEEILGSANIETVSYLGHVVEKPHTDVSRFKKHDRLVKTIFSTVVTTADDTESISSLIGDINLMAELIDAGYHNVKKFNGYKLFLAEDGKLNMLPIIAHKPIDTWRTMDEDIHANKNGCVEIDVKAFANYPYVDNQVIERLPKRYYDFSIRKN